MNPLVARFSTDTLEAGSIDQLTRPLLEMLGAISGLESTYLTLIDLSAGNLHVAISRNDGELIIPEGLDVPWEDTLCKRALDEGRYHTKDVPKRWGDSEAAAGLGIQTYVSAPIRAASGELIGTLCAASKTAQPVTEDTKSALRLISSLIANWLERDPLAADCVSRRRVVRTMLSPMA